MVAREVDEGKRFRGVRFVSCRLEKGAPKQGTGAVVAQNRMAGVLVPATFGRFVSVHGGQPDRPPLTCSPADDSMRSIIKEGKE
jgi:hypothetical protein